MSQADELPILYSFRRCPYAMRARMALAVSETKVSLREVLLRDKPDEMIAASQKGTVPVLIEDGAVIDESLSVMDWALVKNDPEGWLSTRDEAVALIKENDGAFKHHLDRYKYATRYENADPPEHDAKKWSPVFRESMRQTKNKEQNADSNNLQFALTHRTEAMKFIEKLEARLASNKFLFGEKRGFADITVFPFIRQFRIADPDWFDAAPVPNVQIWLGDLMASDLFVSVMQKYPLWKKTGEAFLFPGE